MSARDLLLPQRALEGLLRSSTAGVNAARKRASRWPGSAVSMRQQPNTTFEAGSNYVHNWVDVGSIQVQRGVWLVVAEVAISSLPYSGYPVFFASMRLDGSDEASAEERTYHTGSFDGMRSYLTSFSTVAFGSTSGGTISLQISQTTGAPSPPSAALRPTLLSWSLIARPS